MGVVKRVVSTTVWFSAPLSAAPARAARSAPDAVASGTRKASRERATTAMDG
jgi:hypothetical protein